MAVGAPNPQELGPLQERQPLEVIGVFSNAFGDPLPVVVEKSLESTHTDRF